MTGAATKTETYTYIYEGQSIAMEILSKVENGGAPVKEVTRYVQSQRIDEPLAMERGGQYYYFHANRLGSVAAITNAAKAIVQSYTYDSFGMPEPSTSFRNSYTYTGREWDGETGLYYYRARYYDPIAGRFISRDPLGFGGGDINLYRYVKGNPIRYTDPSGLDAPGCDLIPDRYETQCRLECCAQHDKCFDDDDCSFTSWLPRMGSDNCDKCNSQVSKCWWDCGPATTDDVQKANYYCAKLHKFITIPSDFPDSKSAKKACEN